MRRLAVLGAILGIVTGGGLVGLGCEFVFSYEAIAAPIGTSGEVGIRVYKDHNNCTLASPSEYEIAGSGIQILGETAWSEVQRNVLEKWLTISLSDIGQGYLMVSKTCSKEGYEEARMPVTIGAPAESGVWAQAWAGVFPFELPSGGQQVFSVAGIPVTDEARLTVDGQAFALPIIPPSLEATAAQLRIFYWLRDGEPVLLLIVGEGIFWRYDHLVDAS